jgi:hypothetical protein
MLSDEYESLRTQLWDQLFQDGPQSARELAEKMQLSLATVIGLVDHAWFSMTGELIEIATNG